MVYAKTIWQDGLTPLSAANMQKIEDGVTAIDPNKSIVVGTGQAVTIQRVVEAVSDGVKNISLPYAYQSLGTITSYTGLKYMYVDGGVKAFPISSTQLLVVALDDTNCRLIAFIATLTDDPVLGKYYSFGTIANGQGQSYSQIWVSNIIQLTSTTYLIGWTTNASNVSYASVLTVSGTSVSWGALQTLSSSYGQPQLMYLTSTTALAVIRYSSTIIGGAILTISGTTVTMGAVTTSSIGTDPGDFQGLVVTDQANNRGIVITGDGRGAIGVSVSGTTITFGAYVSLATPASYGYTNLLLLSTNTILVVYTATNGTGPKYAVIVTINSSNVVVVGTPVQINASLGSPASAGGLVKVSATRVDYFCTYSGTSYHYILTISGTSITAVTASSVLLPNTAWLGFLFVPITGATWPYVTLITVVAACLTVRDVCIDGSAAIVGLAKETKTSGNAVLIDTGNVLDGFTGLTIGATYYVQNGGAISTNISNSAYKLGVAISSTQIRRAA